MYQATTPCPKCGAQNLRGTWVCTRCGNTLIAYCPHCRAANVSGSKFCQSCGQPVSGAPAAPGQAPAGAPPQQQYYQQPPPGYQQQGYQQTGYQPQQPGYPPPPYGQYDYQQYPGGYPTDYPPAGGGDFLSQAQRGFESFTNKVKDIVSTTNPILLSAMVILVVGMGVFLLLAFQLGWIKTGSATSKTAAVTDKTGPVISAAQVKPGDNKGAIIYWITDEPSSSQVLYGIWPNPNTYSPVQNDPTTGTNSGVLIHEVGLTGLIQRTTYIYRCISWDKYGNKTTTPDLQFQTSQ